MKTNKRIAAALVITAFAFFSGVAAAAVQLGNMDAYYDGKVFTINFMELPSGGESANLQHNASINTIYMCDQCMTLGLMFVAVLDAIQGDGFNPLWQEAQIAFKPGVTPFQLTSDNDIAAAEAAGTITVTLTDEVYRCSVIGPKK